MGSQSVRRNSATKQQLSYFLTEPEQIPYMELNMQVSFKSDVYKQYWNISFNQAINRGQMCPRWNPGFIRMTEVKARTSLPLSSHGFSLSEETIVIN